MYSKGKVYAPFEMDESQDMWVAEINYNPQNKLASTLVRHEGCVEVRAESRPLLSHRVNTIVEALNK